MKKNNNVNSRIAELILRAQNASDGGKSIDYLVSNKRSYRDNCAGYGAKDKFIFTAITMIARNRRSCDFKFAVTDGDVTPYLVYFETRINGEKFQVSFHSYDNNLVRYKNNSFRIKWDRGSSRFSAITIYKYCIPNGEYGRW